MSLDIAKYSIKTPVNTWLLILGLFIGGLVGFSNIGQLEDPAFTIKQVMVNTQYPGASAEKVEREVTEPLEIAIQQMSQLKRVTSISKPGISEITVEVEDHFDGDKLPQIWDELRKRVNDIQADFPAGVMLSKVVDDFGDVYGLYYALTGEGFSSREMRDFAKHLRRELLKVDGVTKVGVAGQIEEQIVVEIFPAKLNALGLSFPDIQNAINYSLRPFTDGRITVDGKKIRVPVSDEENPVNELSKVTLPVPGQTAQLKITDFAKVSIQPAKYPRQLIRFNGQPALTVAVAVSTETNVVKVGAVVNQKLDDIIADLPAGVELSAIYDQAQVVDDSIDGFITNLLLSVTVVTLTLFLFMGTRAAIVVGSVLVLTVIGSILFMWLLDINMQRISLGAMVIAMGMLVDNAIVVAEGMMMRMQQGKSALEAASFIVKRTKWPLLGATIIGISAFSGIGLSDDATGEFLYSLFAVILITLMLSWVLAVSVVPLIGSYVFKQGDLSVEQSYSSVFYRLYRALLVTAVRFRWTSVLILVLITGASYYGFGMVKQSFFPPSNTPMFYVNYWGPQGRDINTTSAYIEQAEKVILSHQQVQSVASYAGQGADRYTLTYAAERPNESYGFFMIRTAGTEEIDALAKEIRSELMALDPDADIYTNRIIFGPSVGAKLEARFIGPDAQVLRELGNQALSVFHADGKIHDIRHNWRDKSFQIELGYDAYAAGVAGVTRADFSDAVQFATNGLVAGNVFDGDYRYPIVLRADVEPAEGETGALYNAQVWSQYEREYVPLRQVSKQVTAIGEETLIHRRDRERSLSVFGEPANGETANEALARIKQQVESIDLPDGYRMEWGGELESSTDAQASMGLGMMLGFLTMFIISVLLFGEVRPPLIIWLTVPMAVNGVVIGLLAADVPFGFMAMLGFLSLFGMLIKNAIVLLEEIELQNHESGNHYNALINASISRLRPVSLAAITTILGMVPLLWDAFFLDMAVTIMGGLAFSTILTLIAVPVFYSLMYRIKPETEKTS